MKIAYFLHTAKATDGSSKAFLHLMHDLLLKGVTPLVILPHKGEICQILQDMHIQYVILSWPARPSTYPWVNTLIGSILFIPRLVGRLLVNSLATLQSIKIIRQFAPDIIHSNSSTLAIGYYTARFLGVPHIWHIREYGDLDFNYHYYPTKKTQQRRYQLHNSYTICITKDIQQHNHLSKHDNSIVIYDGVLSKDCTAYKRDKEPYFLYAGRLEHAKGIIPLIDAYNEYVKKTTTPLCLYVAGGGADWYIEEVKSKIQQYGLGQYIQLLGVRKDILEIYRNAKAFIVPSLSEGFGFITAEAMFCGCLVIGNNTAGTKEQFDNGKEITGEEIALRYSSQEQLIKHLIDVTNSSALQYEAMILRGQTVAQQLYSTEENANMIYNFYLFIAQNTTKKS